MSLSWRKFVLVLFALGSLLAISEAASGAGIVTDSQDSSTRNSIDDLKRRDSDALRKFDDQANLTYAPLYIFIPGILGSKIEECDKKNGIVGNCTSIWGHKGFSISLTDISIKSNKAYRTTVLDNFEAMNQEKDFYGEALAYLYSLRISNQRSLIAISYDWRQDNRQSALRLNEELCGLSSAEKKRRIVFVAHSMGGLVLRYWLAAIYGHERCQDDTELNPKLSECFQRVITHSEAEGMIKAYPSGY
jgi:Lecithin:cholesterol acyltransferase